MDQALAYLEKLNSRQPEIKVSIFHLFLAAGVRTMALRPHLNRFVKGKTIYQHNNIQISFVVKKELTEDAAMSNAKITFSSAETLSEVVEKTLRIVNKKREKTKDQGEKELDLIMSLPRWLIRLFVGGFKLLDYCGLAPKGMIEADPMYTSVYMANMGSIDMDAPFHHVFNWGTASLFVTIGKLHREPVVVESGKIEANQFIDVKFTLDNRITEGMYCAKAIQLFTDFVQNPEKLEQPLDLSEDAD